MITVIRIFTYYYFNTLFLFFHKTKISKLSNLMLNIYSNGILTPDIIHLISSVPVFYSFPILSLIPCLYLLDHVLVDC